MNGMNLVRHVAVLMGGQSTERAVSLCSGQACADALESQGFQVSRVDVGRDVIAVLQALNPNVIFNMLHGAFGGDGTLQGIFEVLRIPYTHSGVLAAALATQKDLSKIVLNAKGIKVPNGVVVSRFDAANTHVLPRPYVIKPIAEGSSLGVFFVTEADDAPPEVLAGEDWQFGDRVICEPYIRGKELSCGVMGDRALGVVETVPAVQFNDHAEKMAPGGSRTIIPARLAPNVYKEVQRMALAAHHALGCKGVSRADFRYDESIDGVGGIFCLEVNNQPGMTATSLLPEMAAHENISFNDLVRWIVEDASLNR